MSVGRPSTQNTDALPQRLQDGPHDSVSCARAVTHPESPAFLRLGLVEFLLQVGVVYRCDLIHRRIPQVLRLLC